MRATDGLQTTITLGSVKPDGQAFSLELSLEMSLPMLRQDEHLPDRSRRMFIRPVSKSTPALPSPDRESRSRSGSRAPGRQGGAGIQRRGTRPYTFKTTGRCRHAANTRG